MGYDGPVNIQFHALKKIKFFAFHAVVLLKTFPLMPQ